MTPHNFIEIVALSDEDILENAPEQLAEEYKNASDDEKKKFCSTVIDDMTEIQDEHSGWDFKRLLWYTLRSGYEEFLSQNNRM